jgi:hypothetical protein
MTKGILTFAHNNQSVDYGMLAYISASFAKKHLNVPISLVTDIDTVKQMKSTELYEKCESLFDKIILTDPPSNRNVRNLHDGKDKTVVEFNNGSRTSVWNLTPYDRTLLIDSDFLVCSDNLSKYWDCENDLMISGKYNDIIGSNRIGYHDRYVSDTGVKLYWATTVMFTKNENTKVFFDLVDYVKQHYKDMGDLYRFDSTIYRNDISFSIAKHILDGFENRDNTDLPPIFSTIDKDVLHDVVNGSLRFLISELPGETFVAASTKNVDVHIMNKRSILRNADKLLDLV